MEWLPKDWLENSAWPFLCVLLLLREIFAFLKFQGKRAVGVTWEQQSQQTMDVILTVHGARLTALEAEIRRVGESVEALRTELRATRSALGNGNYRG